MAKLSELKALLAAAKQSPSPRKAPTTAAPGRAPRNEERAPDIDLREAFADVQPLGRHNRTSRAEPRAATTPAQRLADEAEALAESRFGIKPSPAHWEVGQELEAEQTFVRKGLGTDVLARLRRGHWSVQGEIDLHRLNRDEARDALADFLLEARNNGWRCVRVVHGKGLGSPNREPVLKNKVRRWLAQRDEVLAYCEAPRHAGGSGAVLVLLKSPSTALR
jgi:DNA-nicking Smr family endonuclease